MKSRPHVCTVCFFHGQKPAIHGQNGMEAVFTVCYGYSSYLYTALNGGYFMRHFYFRLIFGIVWLAAAVVSVVRANTSFAALYMVLGIPVVCLFRPEKGGGQKQ